MKRTIALAGNPNSGKTTLFNYLTGANQYVGNWPGVTVEKKTGKWKQDKLVALTDLPGIYSLSPYTLEEVVARDYLLDEKPNAIINIIDGTNLERNLYLTTQLLELSIPVVIAVNMMDVVRKNGDIINTTELSRQLGCPVVEISAAKGEGINHLMEIAIEVANREESFSPEHVYEGVVEHTIAHIEEATMEIVEPKEQRWNAIKLFERDEKAQERLNLPKEVAQHVEQDIVAAEKELDDDAESIITNARYTYIGRLVKGSFKKKNPLKLSTSDKIDRIVTNKWLALPIFAFVIWFVYYVSVTSVGAIVTDFTNDTLFGTWISPGIRELMVNASVAPWLVGLVVDGIIGGVGAVLGFVPQIFVLFIMLAILEECGYMSRIAFVLDRVFRKFGLSGKSFIPMLIGTGCGIPGVMASRTIENERDRRMTIMTTTFMPCGAKLPIIALIAGSLFGGAGWVAPSAYFLGIGAIVVSGVMLKKTRMFAGNPAPFVMEMPAYHLPRVSSVFHSMWERGWSFIKKAGTIILLSTIVIWLTSNFSWSLQSVDGYEGSMLESIGSVFAILFRPLGFGNAKAAIATLLGLVAKENVVGTFGILYGFGEVADDGSQVWSRLAADYTAIAGYSFLAFNLLCAPCFAAIAAIKREMNNVKWTWFAIGYQTVFAYLVSLSIYQIGRAVTGNINIIGFIVALVAVALGIFLMVRPYHEATTYVKKGKPRK